MSRLVSFILFLSSKSPNAHAVFLRVISHCLKETRCKYTVRRTKYSWVPFFYFFASDSEHWRQRELSWRLLASCHANINAYSRLLTCEICCASVRFSVLVNAKEMKLSNSLAYGHDLKRYCCLRFCTCWSCWEYESSFLEINFFTSSPCLRSLQCQMHELHKNKEKQPIWTFEQNHCINSGVKIMWD